MKDMMTVTDIHCHLLPKVDDGACDSSMTRAMLKKAYNEGVRDIIVTPHFRRGMFETPADIIRKRFQKVRVYAANLGEEGIRLHFGCEYYREIGMAEKLKRGFRPTLAGGKYVLVEFSGMDSYARIRSELYELVTAGYIPIVAHAERYDAFLRSLDNISNAIALGAQIQVNADSILGKNGGRAKKMCKMLMEREEIHFVGSDAHDISSRPSRIGKCAHYVEKKWGRDAAVRIFQENPDKILKR